MRTPPHGYTARAATPDDVSDIGALCRAADVHEFGHPNTVNEEIADEWSVPGFDVATDTWLVWSDQDQDQDQELCGYAWLMARKDHQDLFGRGVVHPNHRGRGIGSYLLDMVEARASQHEALATFGHSVTQRSDVSAPDSAAHELFERRGFSMDRHFWRMDADLVSVLPDPSSPNGIEIRNFVPGTDEHRAHEAIEEAFADHYAHVYRTFDEWMDFWVKWEGFDPSLWFLAVDGDEIAGGLMGRIIDDVGWVYTLGVRQKWRRRRIGESLLRRAFAEFKQRGARTSSLVVDSQNQTGATAVYERVGMSVVTQHDMYVKQLRAGQDTEGRLQVEA